MMKQSVAILIASFLFFGCNQSQEQQPIKQETKKTAITETRQPEQPQIIDEDCTRGEPSSIVDKSVFPNTTFTIANDGLSWTYETVQTQSGDKLIIAQQGCENYIVKFRFETKRYQHDIKDKRFWIETAAELLTGVEKGIHSPIDINDGIKQIKEYLKNSKVNFEDGELKTEKSESVTYVSNVEETTNGTVTIEITFFQGI